MRHRPDTDDVLPWLDATADDPQHGLAALTARVLAGRMSEALPLVAWPLLEGIRRAAATVPSRVLEQLDVDLGAWERRFSLNHLRGPISVAAQSWLVQDLHCLADLHNHAGDGAGSSWSQRGHAAEAALHARLWDGATYHDLDDEGRPKPLIACDAWQPLLLLDTPPERVALLVERAVDGIPAAALTDPAGARLALIGLRRHGRLELASQLAARIFPQT